MKIKRLVSLFCAIFLSVSLMPSAALATENKETVIDLGDGFYAVETIEYLPQTRAGDTVRGTKNIRLYYSGTLVGTTTLGGVFDTSGSTAKATAGYITGVGSNGWSYDGGSTRCSGNTVYGTATYRSDEGVTKSHSGSLSCSPDGTLS